MHTLLLKILSSRYFQAIALVLALLVAVNVWSNGKVKDALYDAWQTIEIQTLEFFKKDSDNVKEIDETINNKSDSDIDNELCGGSPCPEADMPAGMETDNPYRSGLSAYPQIEQEIQDGHIEEQREPKEVFYGMPEGEYLNQCLDCILESD